MRSGGLYNGLLFVMHRNLAKSFGKDNAQACIEEIITSFLYLGSTSRE